MPRHARLSSDGRFEILEGVVALPRGADVDGARVRHEQDGLRITMPVAARKHGEADSERLQFQQQEHQRRKPAVGSRVHGAEAGRGGTLASTPAAAAVHRKPPAQLRKKTGPTPQELALAQGVEMVSEEYPWPKKHPDAAEGWYDNRGEFHEY